MKSKILIDTDPGVDDSLALFFALGLSNISVEAVTTCCGNSGLEVITRNAHYILERAGASSLPVGRGASRPLAQDPIVAAVHGKEALGRITIPRNWQPAQQATTTALDAMTRFLSDRQEESRTIVALAPLTNIAELITKFPNALRSYDTLIILGGTHSAPGNKGPVAEFNFRSDPEAADIVLERCPCPIRIVPLDVCMRNTLSLEDFGAVQDPAFRTFLQELCRDYGSGNDAEEGIAGILMYDPIAVFCAAHPECFTFQDVWMRVDTGSSFARGMSVVDRRLRSNLGVNVAIATDVNWNAFVSSFFAALARIHYVSDNLGRDGEMPQNITSANPLRSRYESAVTSDG